MAVGLLETTAPRVRDASAKPLHVAHLIEALGPGGAERLLYTNLKHFDPARVRSTVLTLYSHATHWREPIRGLGVEVVNLDCRGTRDLPGAVARLRAWLRRERPDLLHTHLWGANVVGRVAGRLSGVPVVSSVHNPDYEPEAANDGSEVSPLKRRAIRGVDRWTARRCCDRLIAVSEYVRQSTLRHLGLPPGTVELLYNPFDADEFGAPRGRARGEVLRELGLPADALMLLNVARVSPQKGQLYAVRALAAVREKFPQARLVLAGALTDEEWVARLEGEVRALGLEGFVHVLGPRRDVPDLLRACDLFVFPSLHEGLGIALIEAMAAGCACVATETGPLPEVVRHGVDGWLTAPGDADGLAGAVCALLADPARRGALGRAAQKSAQARFEPQAAADKLAAIYHSVVRARRGGAAGEGD